MNAKTINLSTMAVMVAGLFAATAVNAAPAAGAAAADQAPVKCMHSNSCKGQGACKQASHACKGQNACKAQGFTMQKSQADCEAAQAAVKKS